MTDMPRKIIAYDEGRNDYTSRGWYEPEEPVNTPDDEPVKAEYSLKSIADELAGALETLDKWGLGKKQRKLVHAALNSYRGIKP